MEIRDALVSLTKEITNEDLDQYDAVIVSYVSVDNNRRERLLTAPGLASGVSRLESIRLYRPHEQALPTI